MYGNAARDSEDGDRLWSVVACPDCYGAMIAAEGKVHCGRCARPFPIGWNGVPILLARESRYCSNEARISCWTPRNSPARDMVKWRSRYWFPRTTPYDLTRRHREAVIASAGANGVVLNLGSGRQRPLNSRHIHLDVCPHPNCTVVADAQFLPFAAETIDAVLCENVFEMLHPFLAAAELRRVVKPGGLVFVSTAFVLPKCHDDEAFRYSATGLRRVFHDWDVVAAGSAAGPFRAFARLAELAVEHILPGRTLRFIARWIVAWGMHPWKYLDPWILRRDDGEKAGTSCFVVVRKVT
ncbi:MAG: methyltransferase domain-containing protein [Planctomycetes bacterium]|nr:methyltransferase domain-containing protein [Planctomycetota bacterium]